MFDGQHKRYCTIIGITGHGPAPDHHWDGAGTAHSQTEHYVTLLGGGGGGGDIEQKYVGGKGAVRLSRKSCGISGGGVARRSTHRNSNLLPGRTARKGWVGFSTQ